MVFGKASTMINTVSPLLLGGNSLEFVTSTKYLGFYIVAGLSFGLSVTEDLCKFYGAINSVLTVLTKPKEQVLMKLLYTNCVPMLSYGAAIKDHIFNAKEKHLFNVAVNNAVRRIFSFRRWQSIRQLCEFFHYNSIEVIFAKARKRFTMSLTTHPNRVLRFLSTLEVEYQ